MERASPGRVGWKKILACWHGWGCLADVLDAVDPPIAPTRPGGWIPAHSLSQMATLKGHSTRQSSESFVPKAWEI